MLEAVVEWISTHYDQYTNICERVYDCKKLCPICFCKIGFSNHFFMYFKQSKNFQ